MIVICIRIVWSQPRRKGPLVSRVAMPTNVVRVDGHLAYVAPVRIVVVPVSSPARITEGAPSTYACPTASSRCTRSTSLATPATGSGPWCCGTPRILTCGTSAQAPSHGYIPAVPPHGKGKKKVFTKCNINGAAVREENGGAPRCRNAVSIIRTAQVATTATLPTRRHPFASPSPPHTAPPPTIPPFLPPPPSSLPSPVASAITPSPSPPSPPPPSRPRLLPCHLFLRQGPRHPRRHHCASATVQWNLPYCAYLLLAGLEPDSPLRVAAAVTPRLGGHMNTEMTSATRCRALISGAHHCRGLAGQSPFEPPPGHWRLGTLTPPCGAIRRTAPTRRATCPGSAVCHAANQAALLPADVRCGSALCGHVLY